MNEFEQKLGQSEVVAGKLDPMQLMYLAGRQSQQVAIKKAQWTGRISAVVAVVVMAGYWVRPMGDEVAPAPNSIVRNQPSPHLVGPDPGEVEVGSAVNNKVSKTALLAMSQNIPSRELLNGIDSEDLVLKLLQHRRFYRKQFLRPQQGIKMSVRSRMSPFVRPEEIESDDWF